MKNQIRNFFSLTIFSALMSTGEVVDLAGVNQSLTTTDLSVDTVITNSASTIAELSLFTPSDASFTGKILGPIAVLKTGGGTLSFPAAVTNSFSGALTVSEGTLSLANEASLGTSNVVYLAEQGCITFAESLSATRSYQFLGATGTLAVASGKTVEIPPAYWIQNNLGKTIIKSGLGRLNTTSVGEIREPSRLVVASGSLYFSGDQVFGRHSAMMGMTLDVRENAVLSFDGIKAHSPIGRLEMTGGRFEAVCREPVDPPYEKWGNTAFRGGVVVHPSGIPSLIFIGNFAHLNHVQTNTLFDVAAGAHLVVDGVLTNGYDSSSTTALPARLIKSGDGTLTLTKPLGTPEGIEIQGGTIRFDGEGSFGGHTVVLSAATALEVTEGVSVSLPDSVEGADLYQITKRGAGELFITGDAANWAGISVEEGVAGFPTAAIPDCVTFSESVAGFGDFASSYTSFSRAGVAGLANAMGTAQIDQWDASRDGGIVEVARLGAMKGATLEIGSLSGAKRVEIVGSGTTRITALAAEVESVYIPAGISAYLPAGAPVDPTSQGLAFLGTSTHAELATLSMEGGAIVDVPAGVSLTVKQITGSTDGLKYGLTKIGDGKMILPNADHRGSIRDLLVQKGSVEFYQLSNLATDHLICERGTTLFIMDSFNLTSAPSFELREDVTLNIAEGKTFSVNPEYLTTAGATIRKTGGGTWSIGWKQMRNYEQHYFTHIVVETGRFSVSGDCFGGHNAQQYVSLEIHENGILSCTGGHLPLQNLTFRGGFMTHSSYVLSPIVSFENPLKWKEWSFVPKGTVNILPSTNGTPTIFRGEFTHASHDDWPLDFHVEEGATFVYDAALYPGYNQNGFTGGSLIKSGKGTLKLTKPVNLQKTFEVKEGTVVFGPGAHLDPQLRLIVSPDAVVELEDNATIVNGLESWNPVLASADVWLDATQLHAEEGASLSSIPNLGKAGGAFVRWKNIDGYTPSGPTFTTNAWNGIPAVSFNGAQGLMLNSYTNQGRAMTIFAVYRWSTWENQNAGKGYWGSPFSLANDDTAASDEQISGSFHFEYGQSSVESCTVMGRDGFGCILNTGAGIGVPVLISTREDRSETAPHALYTTYLNDQTEPVVTEKTLTTVPSYAINRFSIGARIRSRKSDAGNACELQLYGSAGNGGNRSFYGELGELITFSRVLSAEEQTQIENYLKKKWFASSASVDPKFWSNGEGAATTIQVPEGSSATFAGSVCGGTFTRLAKTGKGTLRYAASSESQSDLTLQEGTVSVLPSPIPSRVEVWIDATDASSITLNAENRVQSIRNKGSAGGAFQQARGATDLTPLPMLEENAINGNTVLSFDGNSGLSCNAYTNISDTRSLFVYGVFQQTSFSPTGGQGAWGAPFSLGSATATENDNRYSTGFFFEYYEKTNRTAILYGVKGASTYTYRSHVPNQECKPYLLLSRQRQRMVDIFEELPEDENLLTAQYTSTETQPAAKIDQIVIGGRLGANGTMQFHGLNWSSNRLWFGRIGEFLIFSHPLSAQEEKEMVAYLRKKWFAKGEGSPVPPAWLAGENGSPALHADSSLTLESGTVWQQGTDALIAGNLTIKDGATLERVGSTPGSALAFFRLTGDLSLAGAITLSLDLQPNPSEGPKTLFTYGGTSENTASWKFLCEHPNGCSVIHREAKKEYLFSGMMPTLFLIR